MQESPSVHDLYRRLTEATRTYFGADRSWVRDYDDSGALERVDTTLATAEGGGELAAGFRLRDGRLFIRRDAAALIERFQQGDFTSHDPAKYAWEMSQLAAVREALVSIIHENIHSLGPNDFSLMQAEWDTTRYPHIALMRDGVAELGAQRSCADILRRAGLTAIDPRIVSAGAGPEVWTPGRALGAGRTPAQRRTEELYFPGSVTAVRDYLELVTSLAGATEDAELRTLIQDGSARSSLDNSLRRVLLAQGLGDLPAERGFAVGTAISRSVEQAFADIKESQGIVGRETGRRAAFASQRMRMLSLEVRGAIGRERGGPGAMGLAG